MQKTQKRLAHIATRSEDRAETLANLARVPIRECGERMVDLRAACPRVVMDCRQPFARQSVVERLNHAQEWLDAHAEGVRLRVGEAYRDPAKQERIFRLLCRVIRVLRPWWRREQILATADRYIAMPDPTVPAPHTTGGAVDVGLLMADGKRADMGPFRLAAARMDYDRLKPIPAANREMLRQAMEHAGFSNYAEEWWHWSYGDSGWALRTEQPFAIYGAVEAPHGGL